MKSIINDKEGNTKHEEKELKLQIMDFYFCFLKPFNIFLYPFQGIASTVLENCQSKKIFFNNKIYEDYCTVKHTFLSPGKQPLKSHEVSPGYEKLLLFLILQNSFHVIN